MKRRDSLKPTGPATTPLNFGVDCRRRPGARRTAGVADRALGRLKTEEGKAELASLQTRVSPQTTGGANHERP